MVAIRSKPKQYGPLLLAGRGTEGLRMVSPTGSVVTTGATANDTTLPPGDLLMAALASCLAISLQMAAKSARVDTGEVRLSIEAFIDAGEPRRFDRFVAEVVMEKITDREVASSLLERAKALCTVSHTLNAEITLTLAG